MPTTFRILGSEMSPYSVKVRSYFRYKAIAHEWIPRRAESEAEYKKYSKLPIIPLVVTPSGEGLQDSTPIIEHVERLVPEPSIHPQNEALAFISCLLEEFGDEWGNKIMFHYRWWANIDQLAASQTLARLSKPYATEEDIASLAHTIRDRMTARRHFVGSSEKTALPLQGYFFRLLDILEPHICERKYLFGARPAFGDFGLAAQLYEASVDPTCGSIIRARAPAVLDWCHRMMEPRLDGPFETWDTLEQTLQPLLVYVGDLFLPWSKANAEALKAGESEFAVELAGTRYVQPPQKYHAKSLNELKRKYSALSERSELERILGTTSCIRYLA